MELFTRAKKTLWIFAHNIGFDSRTLLFWQELDSGRFSRIIHKQPRANGKPLDPAASLRAGLLVTTDPPTVIECWARNGGRILLVDTMNYWPLPLKTIGEWVGLEKGKLPDPWDSDQTWYDYCRRDAEILFTAIMKYIAWVKENQLGVFSYTLPSQAMHGYRHTMASKCIVIHDEKDVQKLEGDSYYGGEVCINKIGRVETGPGTVQLSLSDTGRVPDSAETRRVHQLDSNSLFPAVMVAQMYPRRLVEWRLNGRGSRRLVDTLGPDCIAECLVDTGSDSVYSRRAGRSGRFSGVFVAILVGPELARAIQQGLVVACRRFARYELADLFSSWVDRWWQLRWAAKLAGDGFSSMMAKRIMNSLYGKFAQRAYSWEDMPGFACADRWSAWVDLDTQNKTICHMRSIAGTVQRAVPAGFHANAFVAISSFVTSYAREHMRTLREIAGERQWYYQGVDSLYVSDHGLANLRAASKVDAARLGALRLEGSADSAEFLGWGLYRFGEHWCRTSIGRGAIECVPGEFEQYNFERLSTALERPPTEGVRVAAVRRTIGASSPVGHVGLDGWVGPMPARWGDSPAETANSRGFYYENLCDK